MDMVHPFRYYILPITSVPYEDRRELKDSWIPEECALQGLRVTAFERKDNVGGTFYYDKDQGGTVWKGCVLVTSPWVTAFSDFPPVNHKEQHMTHEEYLQYLREYASHFDLWPYISFNHSVFDVRRECEGGWRVTVRNDQNGEVKSEVADFVAICTGLALNPNHEYSGHKDFSDDNFLHANDYKTPDRFRGKKVLVIGSGESALGISAEISKVADQLFLSFRRGKFVIPRMDCGKPSDYDTNRIRYACSVMCHSWYMAFRRRVAYGLRQHDHWSAIIARSMECAGRGPMFQAPAKTDEFIGPLMEGRIQMRPEVRSFRKNTVVYEDFEESVDSVIVACGYIPCMSWVQLPSNVSKWHPGSLYLRMFVPEIGKSLAFCGYVRPNIGAIPPTGELQARYFALVASGQRQLPSEELMNQAVKRQIRENRGIYSTEYEKMVVNWIPYMDSVAEVVGCRPNPWKLMRDPQLLRKVMTGPFSGAIYRLHGTGATPIGRESVLRLDGTQSRRELMVHVGMLFWSFPFSHLGIGIKWKSQGTYV
ncbi:Flavin monooxygenase-like protein [Gracilaria domingensis]|nr:Flavin monooxygenase-like protein [Gracilaria domingensis]